MREGARRGGQRAGAGASHDGGQTYCTTTPHERYVDGKRCNVTACEYSDKRRLASIASTTQRQLVLFAEESRSGSSDERGEFGVRSSVPLAVDPVQLKGVRAIMLCMVIDECWKEEGLVIGALEGHGVTNGVCERWWVLCE